MVLAAISQYCLPDDRVTACVFTWPADSNMQVSRPEVDQSRMPRGDGDAYLPEASDISSDVSGNTFICGVAGVSIAAVSQASRELRAYCSVAEASISKI